MSHSSPQAENVLSTLTQEEFVKRRIDDDVVPTDVDDMDDDIFSPLDDLGWPEDEPSMEDMGLCPHGYADDEDCDQCVGGPSGWDE